MSPDCLLKMFALQCIVWWGLPVLVIAVVIKAAPWFIWGRRYLQLGSKIPGPPAIPLLGNLLQGLPRRNDALDYFTELLDCYGPVCKGWIGPHLAVGLSDPKDAAVILSSSKTLSRTFIYKPVTLIFGNSLISSENKAWKKFRRLMEPAFVQQIVNSYVSIFQEKSRSMADAMEKFSDGDSFDVLNYTMNCTLEMLSETSLGVPTNLQVATNKHHSVVINFLKLGKILTFLITAPWFWFKYTLKLSTFYHEICQLVQPIRNFVDLLIKEKISSHINAKGKCIISDVSDISCTNTPNSRLGFMDHMVSTMINKPGIFTEEELQDETMFLIAAGTETTAYTVATALMLLGLHQDVQRKVVKEQEDIFGEDTNRSVTERDLKEMVYLEQVIKETMRLYPPVPIVGRWVDEDVRIKNYTIPAGTTVMIPIYRIHREPSYYPDPIKFDPERFNKENSSSRPNCSFIPFSSGRKMCLGKKYAYIAMKTMLSVVLRRYQVLEYGSRNDMECYKFELFLKLVNGYNIKLKSRMLKTK
ncbi:cytochrome P450 4C1-like [Bacillus rossius redtenbacheri]|uniref:cytochrome P450 4C1-like n=1 Tax=Bacillus rossius redtenbacheri TaxID=93214 RepID=UPI002FDD435A